VDAVASRVETAARMKQVTYSMSNIVVAMERSMQEMNLEKVCVVESRTCSLNSKMTQIMDQFEQQFEDMDVQSDYVESTINTTTALSTPQDQVDDLISEV
jgi:charged multivesicular body protein 1